MPRVYARAFVVSPKRLSTLDGGESHAIRAIVVYRARRQTRVRGLLKKYLLVCSFLIFLFQAHTSQLALIVLNTASWGSGRLPRDWQIRMNHGNPDISVCRETGSCLRLKSVKSSFALEHSVDVDPAQMPFLT